MKNVMHKSLDPANFTSRNLSYGYLLIYAQRNTKHINDKTQKTELIKSWYIHTIQYSIAVKK